MIKLVVLDIDGVITDGTVLVDSSGREQKRINLKDIDAIFELNRRGYKLAAITGEETEIVDYFEKRFPWEFFYKGNKTKRRTMEQIASEMGLSLKEICYVGDGKYDVDIIKEAGLGICPADAIDMVKLAADIILQNTGGNGCIWEVIGILERYNDEESGQNYFYKRMEEHVRIFKSLASDIEIVDKIMQVGDEIVNTYRRQGAVYLCGNGGSAADAQHIATEFISRFYKERKALNAEALSVNTATITAVANDYGFERIFARQMEAKGKKGDILIGISTSGTSRNVLEALKYCKENEIRTVLLTGKNDKYEVEEEADYTIKIPSAITPRVQEAHIFVGHVLAEYVEHKLFAE